MIFTYAKWSAFCQRLNAAGIHSVPAREITSDHRTYLVLKHDVETDVSRAYKIAEIEHSYGHRGSFYVQAYLLEDGKNLPLLKQMEEMGHEISYHYDVLDACKGNIGDAITEFDRNKRKFEQNGFLLKTVCQHGNPVIERVGYTSNRDFFRNEAVRERYPDLADIMVNFKSSVKTEYDYYSDAGRKFQLIYDPIENDRVNSDDKNVPYDDLDCLFAQLNFTTGNIISMHPHRWTKSAIQYQLKTVLFMALRGTAKVLLKIPFVKRLMNRYYYLAKKV